jgi:hypothetical protein
MEQRFMYLSYVNTYPYAIQYRTVLVHEETGSPN